MAQIRFKHNQEWRNLEIPLQIIMNNGGAPSEPDVPVELEKVIIRSGADNSAFPDLSPYISDLSQIELMVWHNYRRTTEGASVYYYVDNYTYYPSATEFIMWDETTLHCRNNGSSQSTPPTVSKSYSDYKDMIKLTGTPAAPQVQSLWGDVDAMPNFSDELIIYYKGE